MHVYSPGIQTYTAPLFRLREGRTSVIIISGALQIPSAIFTESFLSFIGLGVKAPMPSLGSLPNMARSGITTYSYKLIFPAIMIGLITLAFNLLGDGLRDAFDPKLRR